MKLGGQSLKKTATFWKSSGSKNFHRSAYYIEQLNCIYDSFTISQYWDLGLDFKKDISINILTQKTVNKKKNNKHFNTFSTFLLVIQQSDPILGTLQD